MSRSVFVLLPLSLLVIAFTVAAGSAPGHGSHLLVLDIASSVITCQASYLLGLTGRDVLARIVARAGIAPSDRA